MLAGTLHPASLKALVAWMRKTAQQPLFLCVFTPLRDKILGLTNLSIENRALKIEH